MRTLFFDCFNGASGDMILGALIDAGVPLDGVRAALGSLAIDGYDIAADRVLRAGVSATKFRVLEHGEPTGVHAAPAERHHHHHHDDDHGHARHDHGHDHHDHQEAGHSHHAHRSLPEIFAVIDRSALSATARERARHLFERLATAEAAIHQMPVERVHLHEVGALDSIIDIVGAVYALESLKVERVVVSPMNVGRGMVQSAHGVFPVPAPATVSLLGSAPVFSRGPQAELLTPTGALLLTAYATEYGPLPAMRVAATGYGAGERDFRDTPNVLRVLIGEADELHPKAHDPVIVVESEIDDMNPQLFGPLMDRLYGAGALDVYYAAVQMKKNRPGTLVTAIAPPDRRDAIAGILFTDTTTIGVRHREMLRERLERAIRTIETPVGPIRFKIASRHGIVVNASPEFEDCVRAASERGLSIKEVQARAVKAWMDREG